MQALVEAFNPAIVNNLMCRNTISVSWDGYLFDCDFNQMLDLKIASPKNHIMDLTSTAFPKDLSSSINTAMAVLPAPAAAVAEN